MSAQCEYFKFSQNVAVTNMKSENCRRLSEMCM